MILGFIGYYVIYMVPEQNIQIKQGYMEVADRHSETVESLIKSYEREREIFLNMIEIKLQK